MDLDLARRRRIRVPSTPSVLTDDVAELAIDLMIAAFRHVPEADRHVRAGERIGADLPLATKVFGRRYGVFRLGQFGQAVARQLEGFGGLISYVATAPKPSGYRYSTLLELAANVDVLILTAAVALKRGTRSTGRFWRRSGRKPT